MLGPRPAPARGGEVDRLVPVHLDERLGAAAPAPAGVAGPVAQVAGAHERCRQPRRRAQRRWDPRADQRGIAVGGDGVHGLQHAVSRVGEVRAEVAGGRHEVAAAGQRSRADHRAGAWPTRIPWRSSIGLIDPCLAGDA